MTSELDAVRAYREGGIITTDTVWRDLADAAIAALENDLMWRTEQRDDLLTRLAAAEERVRELEKE